MKALARLVVALLALLTASVPRAVLGADARAEVVVRASLRFEAPQIDGTTEIRWKNPGPEPATHVQLRLFANRFRSFETANDLARQLLVSGSGYVAGGTEILAAEAEGESLRWEPHPEEHTVVGIELKRLLQPGEEVTLNVRFRTTLPNLLDVFSATDGLLVADGGWYPAPLPAAERSLCPVPARLWATLTLPTGATLLLDGQKFTGEHAELAAAETEDRLSFVLSREPLSTVTVRAGERSARIETVPTKERTSRVSPNEEAADVLRDTLRPILAASKQERELVVVRLPLRWYASASASGMVLVSDRLLEIFPMLRPLHQRELAYAVFLAEERRLAAAREPAGDRGWVAEGLAWRRAEALYAARFREGREVKDWIGLFNIFAIVDRFETAPRIPLLRPFFPVSVDDEPLGIRAETGCAVRPPGRFVFDKLETRLGAKPFADLLGHYAAHEEPFREAVADTGGDGALQLLAAWLKPHAPVNYALEDVERDPGGKPGASFSIRRESRETRPDTVEVAIEHGDRFETSAVELTGETTRVEREAANPVAAVVLDPWRKTVETKLADNRAPPAYQFLLDSADVEVSSTEFGVSTLLVGRRRYDYHKDLAMAAFYTSRGYGLDAGFQLHGGPPIDANVFRHNLFAYYAIQELDRSFGEDSDETRGASGRLGGFGLRFNSYNSSFFENPSGSYHLRAFFDGYDSALGGDFGFVQGGGSLAGTFPVRHGTTLALQVLNGFSASTGGEPIPTQGLFSLGGFRSIRGIGAEEELGEDILILRGEVRHLLPMRLDWNLQELLIARRLQLKAFVDTGTVENSSRRLYDPSRFAVGVGAGVNLFYDVMGFFPTTFYLDLATRADRGDSVQVLFGVGQPF